ncbi:protein SIEVE ELEMENT OCCLUSION B-like [Arachis stenosperma]|uniref:protein SIEVE ELEMENT OCCLUSION B-like n=1 Tax=Arachis stenosperma TaxID=217475 RepID=UPI0025AC8F50|nr:protein SIEVE ELEMENT OCCLUSION B-like [Arachis stenosperma]
MASTIATTKKTDDGFEFNDDNILDQVYLTHVISDVECDTKILYELVSNILLPNSNQSHPLPPPLSKPEFLTLKLVSCQMIATRSSKRCAHQTTMWILQQLRRYSWDAKVMITLAAFCLEYGNFVYLDRASSDVAGTSLRQLNQIQIRKESAKQVTELVRHIGQAVLFHINQWADLSAQDLEEEDVPALNDAFKSIPLLVYWTIASIVASTANLLSPSPSYSLSEFKEKLTMADDSLAGYLETCMKQKEHLGDSQVRRKKVIENPKDIIEVLRALIMDPKTGPQPQIHEGLDQVKKGVEIFKGKYVLLFISTLDRIEDEIRLVNSIYDGLLANNDKKEKGGYHRDEFKIVWIPIVHKWEEGSKERFKNLKRNYNIKWYSVEYLGELPGRRIIEDDFVRPYGFDIHDRPIIPVLGPHGRRINENALDLIFQWGIDAFPFRKEDGTALDKKWTWLWDAIKKVNPTIEPKREKYMFIYGGSDNWVQKFTSGVNKLKKNKDIEAADVEIDYHNLGKRSSSNDVYSFWVSVERKSQKNKQHKDPLNCEIQEIARNLLCLKRDPQGWVILTKGRNIKLFAHGDPMYQTLSQFQNWKDKVHIKEGFDIPLTEYYHNKENEISERQQPCSVINSSSVIATITCPNPTCGRVMEVTSVNYKCCHRDDDPNYCGY